MAVAVAAEDWVWRRPTAIGLLVRRGPIHLVALAAALVLLLLLLREGVEAVAESIDIRKSGR